MSRSTILVVEDEAVARRVLEATLARAGYAVTAVGSGEEAITQLDQQRFDLLLTDLQLHKIDGIAVMAAARERDPEIEVIVLTGYATIDSAIAAVRHGAANYILKPGQPGEIEHSVAQALDKRKVRLDRAEWLHAIGQNLVKLAGQDISMPATQALADKGEDDAVILSIGDLEIDTQRYQVTRAGESLQLSSGEFTMLHYFAQHCEQVVSPQQLVRDMLGYDCTPQEARDLVKARVWALRRKIEVDPSKPQILVSVRGVGYMLAENKRL